MALRNKKESLSNSTFDSIIGFIDLNSVSNFRGNVGNSRTARGNGDRSDAVNDSIISRMRINRSENNIGDEYEEV